MTPSDASLIVAAPDLLEALEMLIHFEPNKWAATCSYERGCWEAAKTAIAKAKNFPSRPADDDGEPQSSYCSSEKLGPVGDFINTASGKETA